MSRQTKSPQSIHAIMVNRPKVVYPSVPALYRRGRATAPVPASPWSVRDALIRAAPA